MSFIIINVIADIMQKKKNGREKKRGEREREIVENAKTNMSFSVIYYLYLCIYADSVREGAR